MSAEKETHGFQTEVRQLLDLMIHSLYSNKEIFLRELISNGSDAADKLRFEALTNDALYEGDGDLKVNIAFDKEARTITISDNGIGMGHEEIMENLGTIAKSGTKQFFQSLTGDQAEDAQLIGQFGVGFYSSFIVADKVTVTSRRAGVMHEGGVRWESSGDGEFTIERLTVPNRGTEVVLHLKEGEDEFLDGFKLRSIVKRYSDHISLPIVMPKEGEDETGEETINSATALWVRSKNDISEQEYNEFYKHIAHDFEDPLAYVHSRVEGKLEYTSVLFVPARAPFDLWDRNVRRGVNLYVRRVFIMDDAEQLMPTYLRFVRGVIDSADLPLNVSREILQKDKQIESIRAGSVKKVLDMLSKIAKTDAEKYQKFWGEFGKVMKEGVIEDGKNRETVAKLLRFATTHTGTDEQTVSLEDYVGRMQEGQDKIYYVTADSFSTAKNSPHLEIFDDRGIEVILLTDEIDEWFVGHLNEFDGKQLRSVAKGELDLDGADKAEKKSDDDEDSKSDDSEAEQEHGELISMFKAALGERVKDVRVTNRLTSSPACLVADEHEMGAHMERLLRSAGQSVDMSKPIMEINPDHAIVQRFVGESDETRRNDWASILFDQAMLSEGGKLDDPAGFVKRMNQLLLSLSANTTDGKTAAPKKKRTAKKKTAKASGE